MAPFEFNLRATAALRSLESWADRLQEQQRLKATRASILLQSGDLDGALRQLAALATDAGVEEVREQWLQLGDELMRLSG